MGFCGSKTNALSVKTGVLSNDCFVDVLNIIPHVIFFLISIPIIVTWSHSVFGKINIVTWVHFQGHTLRWLFTIALFWLNVFEVMEGILSDALDPDSTNFHVFIPQCIATICTVLSITFYHHVEMWNSPRFLLLLMLYWASALACKVLKFVSLTRSNVELSDLRFWLTVFVIVSYCLLLLIELNVFRIQRYALFKNKNLLQPLDEIADTRYDYSYVNFLSKATFWWILGLLREGYKHILEMHHLGRLPVSEHTKTNMNKLQLAFEAEKVRANNQGRQPSFTRSYLRAFWPMLGLAAVYRFLGDMLGFVGPWLIENIVTFAYTGRNLHDSAPANVTNATSAETYVHVTRFFNNGYILSVVLFLSCIFQKAFLQSHHYLVIRQAIRLRNAVQGMLYEKSLKLSTLMLSSGQLSVGQILNFMSTDAIFVHNLFFFIHYIWATPIQITVAFVLIYLKLGISAVIGGIAVVLVLPFQYFVARGLSKIQKKILVCTDERMKLASELIQGIRPLKQFVWERLFTGRVEAARSKELKHVFRHAVLLALIEFITVGTPIIGMLITFSLYTVLEEEPLTAGKVFSTVALFNVLLLPLFTLTIVIHAIVNARVSSQRLLPFFLAPEVEGLKLHDAYMATEAIQCGDGEAEVKLSDDLTVKFFPGLLKNKSTAGRRSCQSSFKGGNSDETSHMTRKYSAPPRMMTHVTKPLLSNDCHTKSHTDGTQKSQSSDEIANDTDIHLSPYRKSNTPSQDSSNSSLDKCELQLIDPHHQKAISCSVSTEDIAEISGSETVIEMRYSVEVHNGSFSWDLENREPCLKDISLKIPTGKLTVVIGAVGSGKSSLLSALLGEMVTLSGTVDWARESTPAYVAQKPWILNTSLRENILLGQPLVWKKYKRVLHACALNADLEILPSGDLTEIGEKGINLSGGQKQRVNLARALYADVNTVLLDDPLSALDSHVSRHVFDTAIMRRLVHKKHTVVLVTHSVQYLSRANQIIVMKDGQIQHHGRLNDIKKADYELYESWRLTLREVKKKEESEHKASKCLDHPSLALVKSDGAVKVASLGGEHLNPDHESLSRRSSVQSQMSSKLLSVASGRQLSKLSVMSEASSNEDVEMDKENATGQLIPEEARERGAVSWQVYITFARACTFWLTAIVIAVNVAKHSLVVAADFWLSHWAGQTVFYNATTTEQVSYVDNWYYLRIYFVMCMCAVLLSLAASLLLQFTVVRAAKSLHHQLLRNIILAPVRFFDTTPSGRILNRFSADTSVIDLKVGQSVSHLLRALLNCVTGAIVIIISTAYFLMVIIPVTILYFIMQRFYLATSRELQRMESLTKSPVFSHFSETLNGLQTIRSYRLQKLFLKTALSHIDNNTIPLLFLHTVNRFVGWFLDCIGSVIALAAAVASLTSAIYLGSDPAFVGISIAYALLMCDSLNWMIRRASEVELQMNAMERIKEYSEVTPEPYDAPGYAKLDDNWPRGGEIKFENVSARYAEGLDLVLREITLTITAGEKIGLCGRTGSGKTSLSASLFRMVDIVQGEISIDGRNITTVPLSRLRSAITAIPQDPLLFYGTVRYNLDPEEKAPDSEIWRVLEMAQLKDTVEGMAQKLDSPITEGGENFSVGQRQLFCFARALLCQSHILVLDEATASVDMATDQLIQSVIAKAFADKTVLTVAHRISTIESYDRVIVLDDGHLAEVDSPAALLQNPESFFYKLAKENKM